MSIPTARHRQHRTLRRASHCASALLAAMLLAACGGGGSDPAPAPDPTPTPPPAATLSAAQGIWQSAQGAATSASAIVLPDGTLWAVLGQGASADTRVVKASLAVQGSDYMAAGKSYLLGGNTSAPTTVAVAASVVDKTSLHARIGTGASAETLSLVWQVHYDTSTRLADLAGAWSATLGPGTVNWSIDAQGRLAGARTTGCTYTGQLSLRPEGKAVLSAEVQEDCAGAKVQLSGVATPQADGRRLSMAMTTADGSQAVLLALAR